MEIEIFETNGDSIIKILNPLSNESACINASVGGTLMSLKLKEANELHELIAIPYHQKYHLQENPFYPSGLLMPWVNRVRNGNYSFLGKNYQLPINETNLGNAIHGFMARRNFEIFEEICNEQEAKIILKSSYSNDFEGFPFPFESYLSYSLKTNGQFEFTISCKNMGETNMPFATGWHPYFQLGNQLNDLTLYFNSIEKYLSDSQMIPLKAVPFQAADGMKLLEEKPDNVYLLEQKKLTKVTLAHTQSNLALNLLFDSSKFPYFVAFCPENEECIALEPMTGNTDCFNTFEGLLELKPNENFSGTVQILLEKIG